MIHPNLWRRIKSRFPVAKRLFDFWFKLFENITIWSLASMLPYFKLTSDSLAERCANIAYLLLIAVSSFYVMYFLADNEAWMSRKETNHE
ncbi:hypothetical protein CWC45_01410 [Neisseria sp. N177_16]|nr:hypothetical protein CWC45_01410 [Neisseria sp. N177_16]